ncbi:hypothetical protein ATANTOWER_016545, partial [Ataeniobius toweri]|nr:hypothetical protein [Ataeniobius toweri]
ETFSTCEGAVLTKKMKLISSSVKTSHRNLLAVKSSFEEKIEALADLEEPLSAKAAKQNNVVTDVEELKEINKTETNLLSSNSPTTGTSQEETHSADGAALGTQARVKTKSQLFMLWSIFLEFQYPDSEQYSLLSRLVGMSRHHLVQWFGDHRYAVKESKPCWMTEEQYNKVLVNIKYQQYKNLLSRGRPKTGAAGPGL